MREKESAIEFLKMVVGGSVQEAYEKFIAVNFIHHNQYFKGDRQSLLEAMEENAKQSPNKQLEVKKVFQDSDTVITLSHIRQNPGDLGGAVAHIFRFENGKVAELWDLGQLIETDSVNENGVF